jgi:hypothetical protein
MNYSAILLIAMLNQGHWIGGQPGEVSLRWTIESGMPAAEVEWRMTYGDATLGSGRMALPAGAKQATLKIVPPQVRVQSEANLLFVVKQADNGKKITEAHASVQLYPDKLLEGLAARIGGKSLAVIDRPDGLPLLLNDVKIPFKRLDDESNLNFTKFDILIVAQDQLKDRPFGQSALLSQASNGASLLVLRQTGVKAVAGYPIRRRAVSAKLAWREGQSLLEHLRARGMNEAEDAWALQLPADEPALELVYWPRETPGTEPTPIDAILVAKTLGRGKLVLCQVPLGDWKQDPVAQLFLADALEYLAGRAEPTPAPSHRPPTVVVPIAPAPQLLDASPISP